MSLIRYLVSDRVTGAAIVAATFLTWATSCQAAGLAGSEWRPTVIGEIPLMKNAEIFVRFEAEGKMKGHGGCNGFFGSYRISRTGLEIGPLGATKMACSNAIMDRETAFMQALHTAKSFKRDRIDLKLLDENGGVVMELVQRDTD